MEDLREQDNLKMTKKEELNFQSAMKGISDFANSDIMIQCVYVHDLDKFVLIKLEPVREVQEPQQPLQEPEYEPEEESPTGQLPDQQEEIIQPIQGIQPPNIDPNIQIQSKEERKKYYSYIG